MRPQIFFSFFQGTSWSVQPTRDTLPRLDVPRHRTSGVDEGGVVGVEGLVSGRGRGEVADVSVSSLVKSSHVDGVSLFLRGTVTTDGFQSGEHAVSDPVPVSEPTAVRDTSPPSPVTRIAAHLCLWWSVIVNPRPH